MTGHFFPTEVAMTIVIGIATLVGLADVARWRSSVPASTAAIAVVVGGALQVLAFRVSLLPYIAQR